MATDPTQPTHQPGVLPRPVEEELVRQNERMRTALNSIRRYAENAAFGGWRFEVAAIVDEGLS